MRSTRFAALASVAVIGSLAPWPVQADPDEEWRPVTQSHWAPGSDEARLELRCSAARRLGVSAGIVEDSETGHEFMITLPSGPGGSVTQTVLSTEPFVDGWAFSAQQSLKDQVAVDLHGRVRNSDWPQNVDESSQDRNGTVLTSGWQAPLEGAAVMVVRTKVGDGGQVAKRRYFLGCEGSARSATVTRVQGPIPVAN